jgi:hypothetical protein
VLSGRAVDAGSLQGLSGIRVVIAGREVATGTDGNWQMSNVSTSASSVTFAGTGYVSQTVSTAGNGSSQDLGDTFLVPAPVNGTGNITGFTTLAGETVGGAILTAGGRTAVSRSDAANRGRFTLYNVPVGIVNLSATYTDPVTDSTTGASFSVTVADLATTSVDVPLTLAPPPPPDI